MRRRTDALVELSAGTDNLMEVIRPDHPRGGFRFALFDFDGTLSLIRQGWQDVMIPMMVEILRALGTAESDQQLEFCVREFVEHLTGKQTIYQMFQLQEEVRKRNGEPLDAVEYKQMYHERLLNQIRYRLVGLKDGSIERHTLMVPGSEDLLSGLRDRGMTLYLASGTDIEYVVDECQALGLTDYFNGGIYGALKDYREFSKKKIIRKMLAEHGLHGEELVGFGDGFVEIENIRQVGGVAVGVASDEVGLQKADVWKRNRLIAAGADLIVPHYRDARGLVDYLFGSGT